MPKKARAKSSIERLPAGQLAKDAVDIEPDELAFAVIILGALLAAPRLRRPPSDDRIVGGVDERTPARPGVPVLYAAAVEAMASSVSCFESIPERAPST